MIRVHWNGPIGVDHPKYAALDDQDKKFLLPDNLMSHGNLPIILIGTGISKVTSDSIPHICSRMRVVMDATPFETWAVSSRKVASFAEYLNRFIGVSSNVVTETSDQFIRRLVPHIVPKLTNKDAKALDKVTKA